MTSRGKVIVTSTAFALFCGGKSSEIDQPPGFADAVVRRGTRGHDGEIGTLEAIVNRRQARDPPLSPAAMSSLGQFIRPNSAGVFAFL